MFLLSLRCFTRSFARNLRSDLENGIIRPERIILVRHAESQGNIDDTLFGQTPDWLIPLTPLGHEQAGLAGRNIKAIVKENPIYVYTSPCVRTKQTTADILESFDESQFIGLRQEPRLTGQQFGNFQDSEVIRKSKRERRNYGRFYFRFPNGESGLDVYCRVTSFIATMFRDFQNKKIQDKKLNVIIVTHGLTLRLFIMRWFQLAIHKFEKMINPPNAGIIVMQLRSNEKGELWYELSQDSCEKLSVNIPTSSQLSFQETLEELRRPTV